MQHYWKRWDFHLRNYDKRIKWLENRLLKDIKEDKNLKLENIIDARCAGIRAAI